MKNEEIKFERLPVDSLTPYKGNARKHAQQDLQAIINSIKEFGFLDPIGIWGEQNIVVEGHGRLLAAKQLGMETVPCIRLDGLTDEQRRAYALAHNKTAELSVWDFDALEAELNNITNIDMDALGFVTGGTKEALERPEVEFGEILGESNNYLVLQFKTDIDWLNAQSVFELEPVKSYSTRKDGVVTKNMEMRGIPRIIDGAKALNKLMGVQI